MDDGDVQIDPEHVTGHGAKEHQKSDKDPHTKKAMALHIDRPEKIWMPFDRLSIT